MPSLSCRSLFLVIIPGGLTIFGQIDTSYTYGYLKSNAFRFDLYASQPADSKGGIICTGKCYRDNIQTEVLLTACIMTSCWPNMIYST